MSQSGPTGTSKPQGPPAKAGAIIGRSPVLQRLLDQADAVARSDVSVVISGESGTGKELIAALLHARSARRDGPFVAVNCGAFADSLLEDELFGHARGAFTGASTSREGRFRAAHGGTLFLDEVGELSAGAQARLLRVLQEGQVLPLGADKSVAVNVRVLSATNRALRSLVEQGRFREDLYYRLKVVELAVPPLRERTGDLPLLIEHFAALVGAAPLQMSPAARARLHRWPWPGNIRELHHAIEHAVLMARGGEIGLGHLPTEISGGSPEDDDSDEPSLSLADAVARFERQHLLSVLRRNDGNRSRTALALGISRKNLWEKMRNHAINDAEIAPQGTPDHPDGGD